MKPSTERNLEIAALYERGLTCSQVAEKFGVTGERIRQILAAKFIERRSRRIDIDPAKYVEAVRLFRSGVTITAAAEAIGVAADLLYRRLIADGLHTPVNVCTEWTPYELRFLTNHYARTLSARQIAESLGRTRNEVIGKANRLRLGKKMLEAAE